jgi:hypothetical protein
VLGQLPLLAERNREVPEDVAGPLAAAFAGGHLARFLLA